MNTGQIIKSKQTERFTIVPNEAAHNPDLSMKAKGLLTFLLSLPSDWVVYKGELSKHFTDGRHAITQAFKELENAGYVLSVQMIDPETHRFKGFNHVVYSTPFSESERVQIAKRLASHVDFPIAGNPISEFPISENLPLQRTNNTKTDRTKTEKDNTSVQFSTAEEEAGFRIFEDAHGTYPWLKGNVMVAWESFLGLAHPSDASLLEPAIKAQKAWKETLDEDDKNRQWPHMNRWIGEKRWLDILPQPERQITQY